MAEHLLQAGLVQGLRRERNSVSLTARVLGQRGDRHASGREETPGQAGAGQGWAQGGEEPAVPQVAWAQAGGVALKAQGAACSEPVFLEKRNRFGCRMEHRAGGWERGGRPARGPGGGGREGCRQS